jgi:DNA-binding beta-propeller fold protein YncE
MKRLALILGVLIAIAVLAVAGARWDSAAVAANPGPIVTPVGPVLLANNQGSGTTTMIEARTGRLVAHIAVGDGPHEIAASPDGRWAVATVPGDSMVRNPLGTATGNKLAVIEVATATLKRTLELGEYSRPHGVAFLSDNRTLAVTSELRHSVVFVDIETGKVQGAIPLSGEAGPYLLALSKDRKRIYTSNIGNSTVSEIDVATRKLLRTLPAPGVPEGMGLSPDGKTIWLAESVKNQALYVLDLKTGATLTTFDNGFQHPHRVGVSPDGKFALITDSRANELRIYDAVQRRELGRLPTGELGRPTGLFFAPDSKKAYVTTSGGIAEVDLASRSIPRRFTTTQTRPDGVVYVPRG